MAGLNAIDGVSVASPNSTFYLFPNVTRVMGRKKLTDINQLMTTALEQANVSFCTRRHFGTPLAGEEDYYIRLAYSGISVPDIGEGLAALKEFFERD